MPIDQAVKDRAYTIDPPCWKSYSGKATRHKQRMDSRRTASLALAQKEITEDFNFAPGVPEPWPEKFTTTVEAYMTPLHILIGIHYVARLCPYGESEPEHRYSRAVRDYTEDLVRRGMLIEREPDGSNVPEHVRNTAAYAPTEGLRMWVNALTCVSLPELREAWIHPALPPRAV